MSCTVLPHCLHKSSTECENSPWTLTPPCCVLRNSPWRFDVRQNENITRAWKDAEIFEKKRSFLSGEIGGFRCSLRCLPACPSGTPKPPPLLMWGDPRYNVMKGLGLIRIFAKWTNSILSVFSVFLSVCLSICLSILLAGLPVCLSGCRSTFWNSNLNLLFSHTFLTNTSFHLKRHETRMTQTDLCSLIWNAFPGGVALLLCNSSNHVSLWDKEPTDEERKASLQRKHATFIWI